MKIPFTKAHGAKNDFLFTWRQDAPDPAASDHAAMARAICDRHTGIGADGWMLVDPPRDADAEGTIQLYNSDGSIAEMSGNGTRCAAAFLIRHGHAAGVVRVRTGAGVKSLRLLERRALEFEFEMNMGRPEIIAGSFPLELSLVDRATSRCFGWAIRNAPCRWITSISTGARSGAEIERHPHFPEPHQRVVREAGGRAHHRRALLGARGGGDDEQRYGVHGRGRDGRGARAGEHRRCAC